MIIFNNTSAEFVLISVENDHNFEQNEDCATVILKWTDFRNIRISGWSHPPFWCLIRLFLPKKQLFFHQTVLTTVVFWIFHAWHKSFTPPEHTYIVLRFESDWTNSENGLYLVIYFIYLNFFFGRKSIDFFHHFWWCQWSSPKLLNLTLVS